MYAFGEGWSVARPVGGVMPWSRFGGCKCYGVYKVCCLFCVCLLVDIVCAVLNSLFYVTSVLNGVASARRNVIEDGNMTGGEYA